MGATLNESETNTPKTEAVMANSITLTKKFHSLSEVQSFISLPIKTLMLASEWVSIDTDHILVEVDRNGSVEVWIIGLGDGLGLDAVPSSVLTSVSQSIKNITDNNARVQELRAFDLTMKSDGRYESDLWFAGNMFQKDILILSQFATDALMRGIDVMVILRSLGLVSIETPSLPALGWL